MTWMAPQNPNSESIEYKSLGLNTLLDVLREGGKYSILDLGQAIGVNVDFWSQFPCRIYIQDFYRGYRAAEPTNPECSRSAILSDLLAFSTRTSFDIILAWDLLNYLDLEDIDALIRHLSPHCRPGTFLFALISSHPEIPEEPNVYKIIDRERMTYETRTQKQRPSLRYNPKELARILSPFEVSSSFLLRNGIQEYVFVYR